MTPSERLHLKFEQLKRDGLLDLKVSMLDRHASGNVTVDDLAEEVLAMIEAYESGNYVDITDKLR